ncbi:MAG: hypothetical protein IRZ29_06400 [Thermoflavifilum sp.]|nr:hypothetical protein [Thermoflavifilum sp.]
MMTKKHMLGGLIVACFSFLALSASAQKAVTVKGEVLDMNCYMAKGAHGAGHASCAKMCMKGGAPAGLLTSDGKVYLLVENHDKSAPYEEVRKHAAEQVEVTGTVENRGGVQALVVDNVKASGGSM